MLCRKISYPPLLTIIVDNLFLNFAHEIEGEKFGKQGKKWIMLIKLWISVKIIPMRGELYTSYPQFVHNLLSNMFSIYNCGIIEIGNKSLNLSIAV